MPEGADDRAERRTGHVDAGRRPVVDHGRERRDGRLDVVVVEAHRLAQPVEQGQDQGEDAEDRTARRRRGRGRAGAAPIAAKTGANDGPGMWMPAGVLGGTRLLPRRAGGARAQASELRRAR